MNQNIKIKHPLVNSPIAFNCLLHITILFTILSLFFMLYISKLSSKVINNEINHLIDKGMTIGYVKMNNILNDNLLNTNITNTFKNQHAPVETFVSTLQDDTELSSQLQNNIDITNLKDQIKNKLHKTINNPQLANLKDQMKNKLHSPQLANLKDQIKNNFSYDYYYNLFSKPDAMRTAINNEVFII